MAHLNKADESHRQDTQQTQQPEQNVQAESVFAPGQNQTIPHRQGQITTKLCDALRNF